MQEPSIPKGTRDFSPEEMTRRNYIFDTLKIIFKRYGYLPIETPAMENLSTLTGKYGEEGDQMIFKILNSRIHESKDKDSLRKEFELSLERTRNTSIITERALRYDLTVPFARYVVQHRNEVQFPFKRCQIQPVWRADKPQKGRYREFFQCDVDVIGSDSLLNEAELIKIIDDAFSSLCVKCIVKLNNRKILAGISEVIGCTDKLTDITVAIDKLDKIGSDKVNEELSGRGISNEAIAKLQPILQLKGTTEEKMEKLNQVLAESVTGQKGISECRQLFDYIKVLSVICPVEFDLTLARGLNYYTGTIIEVKAADMEIGSICGGGRYDDLTGVFGLPGVSGVGISFGADRIFDVMNQLNLFPADTVSSTRILFVNFGEKETRYCLPLLSAIRKAGINAEMYPDPAKIKKQMAYADRKGIAFVAMTGEDEIKENCVTLKNMKTGEQKKIKTGELMDNLII